MTNKEANFLKVTFASIHNVDWGRFLVAITFGYCLSVSPVIFLIVFNGLSPNFNAFEEVMLSPETFLIFSILAFSSVGNILNNAEKIDLVVLGIFSANILLGIFLLSYYNFLKEAQLLEKIGLSYQVAEDVTTREAALWSNPEIQDLMSKGKLTKEDALSLGKWLWVISGLVFVASHLRSKKDVSGQQDGN